MSRRVRSRFWLELGLASLTGVLFLITLVSRDWIEPASGWDPDRHSGSLEWGIVLGLLALTTVTAGLRFDPFYLLFGRNSIINPGGGGDGPIG